MFWSSGLHLVVSLQTGVLHSYWLVLTAKVITSLVNCDSNKACHHKSCRLRQATQEYEYSAQRRDTPLSPAHPSVSSHKTATRGQERDEMRNKKSSRFSGILPSPLRPTYTNTQLATAAKWAISLEITTSWRRPSLFSPLTNAG